MIPKLAIPEIIIPIPKQITVQSILFPNEKPSQSNLVTDSTPSINTIPAGQCSQDGSIFKLASSQIDLSSYMPNSSITRQLAFAGHSERRHLRRRRPNGLCLFATTGLVLLMVCIGGIMYVRWKEHELRQKMTSGQLDQMEMTNGQLDQMEMTSGQLDQMEMTSAQLDQMEMTNGQLDQMEMTNGQLDQMEMTSGQLNQMEMNRPKRIHNLHF